MLQVSAKQRQQAKIMTHYFKQKGYRVVEKLLEQQIAAMIKCTDWDGKTVLELGAYDGRHGEVAVELGAMHVIAIEGRPANLSLARPAYPENHVYVVGDVTAMNSVVGLGRYDIGLAFGILYHLESPIACLSDLLARVAEVFIWSHVAGPDKCEMRDGYLGESAADAGSEPFAALRPMRVFFLRKEELAMAITDRGWDIVECVDMPTPVSDRPAVFIYARKKGRTEYVSVDEEE